MISVKPVMIICIRIEAYMIIKKDKLRPTQPYFVMDTEDFYQEIYLEQGISHFYTFNMDEEKSLRIVPDGCIDLFFEYNKCGMQGYACGTRLSYTCENEKRGNELFGIRFMPGIQPEMINLPMKELLDHKVPLENIIKGETDWLKLLAQEADFYQRIRVFIEYYTKAEKTREKPYGKKKLVQSVKSMVYESNGLIKVNEMRERTGYTERYINKVFIEEMGFSPKLFCKIIQFQRALEILNYGTPESMTDTAMALGYYDQPHFIRDFSKYAGITPKKYLKLVESEQYVGRIKGG